MYGMSRLKKAFTVTVAFLLVISLFLTSVPVSAAVKLSSKQKNAIRALLKVVDPAYNKVYFGKSTKVSARSTYRYIYWAAGHKTLYGHKLIRPYKINRNTNAMDDIVYTKKQVVKISKGIFGNIRKISYSGIMTKKDKCYFIYEEPNGGCEYKVYATKALKNKSIAIRASAYSTNSEKFVGNIQMTLKPSKSTCFGYYIVEIKRV